MGYNIPKFCQKDAIIELGLCAPEQLSDEACGIAGSAHSKIYTFHNQMMRFSARTFIAA
jgi:hypothetical protein